MSTYALASYATMLEQLKHDDKNSVLLPLINSLSERIDLIRVAHVEECNDGTGHQGVREFSQPTGTWRAYNQGIASEFSTSEPYREPTAMLDSKWHADKAMLLHAGNPGERRMRMIGQSMAGMMKNFSSTILYGDRSTDGKRPQGIMTRAAWNTLSSARVFDNAAGNASGTANKTSMLLIGFGADKTSLIYPANDAPAMISSQFPDPGVTGMGVKVIPLSDDYVFQAGSTSAEFLAVRNYLELHFGLAINDERFIQRICNISTTNIDGVDDFSFDENVMIDALTAMPNLDNAFWFVNKTLKAQLWKRVSEKGNVFHTATAPWGAEVLMAGTVPVLEMSPADIGRTGGILNTEATVT